MRYITVKEARDYIEAVTGYRPGLTALYRWAHEKRFAVVRIGSRVLISKEDLEAMLTPQGGQKEMGGQI